MMRAIAASLAVLAALGAPALAGGCRNDSFDGTPYTICEAAPGSDLRLFLNDANGAPLGSFGALRKAAGRDPVFAMNAGMYHPDRSPVGLYIEHGTAAAPLVRAGGSGNFGLLPNGVFCIGDRGFAVIETRRFARTKPACTYATQSGPMLVIDGALHPRFLPDSDSTNIRNGVGVRPDGTAVFAISGRPVTFHAFARLFRDALGTPQALYLDGSISRLYAPALGRDDIGFAMGPMVALMAEGPD